jgi:hypothetical protein
MASILKQASKNKGKGKASDADIAESVEFNGSGSGAATTSKAVEKRRKDKVLMVSSRGVTGRMRHLMHDLEVLLPHVKKGELRLLPPRHAGRMKRSKGLYGRTNEQGGVAERCEAGSSQSALTRVMQSARAVARQDRGAAGRHVVSE